MTADAQRKTRTLWLAGVLHAFTHLYQVALLPLYLPIQADLKLQSVGQATLLVTVMMLGYFVPSYPMGVLADRVSRKKLLGIGLALNGLGFVGLALAPNYATALACVVFAGVGGSFYHPAATAMVARLFPVGTGKALGLLGIGASIGFFLGPIYTGWRAETSGWRAPVLELGVLGILGAILFAWLADDKPVMVAAFPHVPRGWIVPTYMLYGFFFMASYPMVEAALMESVPDAVRGRVFGFFITVGGLVGNTAHWLMGNWVEGLGARANRVENYYGLYGLLALMLLASLAGLPCLHAIRRREKLESHVSQDVAQSELRNPQFE